VLLLVVLLLGLLLAARTSMVTFGTAAALVIAAVALSLLVPRVRPPTRTAIAVGGWVLMTLLFFTGTRVVRAEVVRQLRLRPHTQVVDVIVSPLPANPMCVSVIAVSLGGGGYVVENMEGSALPSVMRVSRCPQSGGVGGQASTISRSRFVELESGSAWITDEFHPIAELATIARESCPALAALRFMRAPEWRLLNDSTVVIGDARYGGANGGFTTMTVPRHSSVCPRGTPPWIPPRADLLR